MAPSALATYRQYRVFHGCVSHLPSIASFKEYLTGPPIAHIFYCPSSYDIFIINLVVPMLGYVYYANSTPPNKVGIIETLKNIITASH
jgi:hypothetical protein